MEGTYSVCRTFCILCKNSEKEKKKKKKKYLYGFIHWIGFNVREVAPFAISNLRTLFRDLCG